jgi:hypothetical protein
MTVKSLVTLGPRENGRDNLFKMLKIICLALELNVVRPNSDKLVGWNDIYQNDN